jgi:site-specific DNA-methyltransferase (adenine-specific)
MRCFQKNDTTVVLGDTLKVLDQVVADGSVNLIFADPPYNIGKKFGNSLDKWETDAEYVEWCEKWLSICVRKLSKNGSMYVMASTQSMPFLDTFLRDKIMILSRIVWCYDSSGVQARSRFGSMYEPVLHCVVDEKDYTFNAEDILVEAKTGAKRKLIDYRKMIPTQYNTQKVPGNVWSFPRVLYRMAEYENHPSQKPEALLERIILASSNEGELVLDPFSGTFTTCAVAQRLNRRCVGIEKELEYVNIGLRRLGISEELDGEELVLPKKVWTSQKDRKIKHSNEHVTQEFFK